MIGDAKGTYRRKDVHVINQTIRAARKTGGELYDEILFQTEFGKHAFAQDDRFLLTQNDYPLGSRNGMLGTVQSVNEDELTICLDSYSTRGVRMITINPKVYNAFDHGYATTIHKSQGATTDKTYLLGSVLMDRHLACVAMIRHTRNACLYGDYNSLQKMRRAGAAEKPKMQHTYTIRRKPSGPSYH